MPTLTPVDHDPFAAAAGGPKTTPVEGDPFAPPAATATVASRIGTGAADPFYGAAQIGARMPQEGDLLSPYAGTADPERVKAVDTAVQTREAEYQKTRGSEAGKRDFWRGVGEFASDTAITAPLMVIPGGPAAKALARVGKSALGGALGGGIAGSLEPVTSGEFGGTKALQTGGGLVAGGVLGGVLGGIESAVVSFMRPAADRVDQQATEAVVRRLQQDAKAGGPTADDALKAVADWQSRGKPVVLADVGGENVQGLAGQVARQPGESRAIAKTTLEGRSKTEGARLKADVEQFVASGPSAYQSTQALLAARSQAARPLYQQAEALQGVWSPRLQSFLEEPDVKKGLARGFHMERLEALAENRPFDPTQMGIDLDAEGNILIRRVPNLRVLDMGKRGLDAMIADERDAVTGRLSAMGRSLSMVQRAYVAELDDLDKSGVYRAARDAWGGPSRSLDAVKLGRSVFNRNPEEMAADVARATPNDREFIRLGVADVLRERIAKVGFGGNEARAIVRNDWMKQQLAPLFRSAEDYDKFVDSVMAEHMMAETRNTVLKGSQTAGRIAEDRAGDLRTVASSAGLAHSIFSGNIISGIRHAAQIWRDLGLRPDEKLNAAVARLLFSSEPKFTAPPPPRTSVGGLLAPAAGSAASNALGIQ